MSAINIEHLTVSYQKNQENLPVLSDVSLAVPAGTVCAIIGPSGCGKSTLLKVAAGLIKDYEGQVTVGGRPLDTRSMTIGFMPQSYGLLPWRTVAENIRLGRKVKGLWQETDEEKLKELASRLGLEGLLERFPHELSGGQQQRVSLARVFLLQPDILLMDEPFSALDAITREEMQDVFRELWQQELEQNAGFLEDDAKRELASLGGVLGRYDPATQLDALDTCRLHLRQHLDKRQSGQTQETHLILGLSFSASLLLGIYLI